MLYLHKKLWYYTAKADFFPLLILVRDADLSSFATDALEEGLSLAEFIEVLLFCLTKNPFDSSLSFLDFCEETGSFALGFFFLDGKSLLSCFDVCCIYFSRTITFF